MKEYDATEIAYKNGYEDGKKDAVKHGYWYTLTDCANAGTYCSVCNKKVYKEHYANVKEKSKFCPNCGSIMDGKFRIL